jgi:hypothetical protein
MKAMRRIACESSRDVIRAPTGIDLLIYTPEEFARERLGVHLRQACGSRDHLLVGIPKTQTLGDETTDRLAQCADRVGDTDDLHSHDFLLPDATVRRTDPDTTVGGIDRER